MRFVCRLLTWALFLATSRAATVAAEPIELRRGPYLFVDDYFIAKSDGLKKVTQHPQRFLDSPILGVKERTTQPYVSVLRDPQTKRFRLWYNSDSGVDCAIAYAESDDGIHWTTPVLHILGPDNRVLKIGRSKETGSYGVNVIDDLGREKDPARRFKMMWFSGLCSPEGDAAAFSPDGIHFTQYSKNPVIPSYGFDDPKAAVGVGDIVDTFYDPIRNRYGALVKLHGTPADGWKAGPRAGRAFRRLVGASYSSDFVNWAQPWRVITPEAHDTGLLEFYCAGGTIARGPLLISFARMLHDDYPAEPGGDANGIGYTTLAISHDGERWQRQDDIFFDRNPSPDTWDRAMTWVGSVLPVGDEMYLYYGGYKRGHKVEPTKERQLGLAKMPLDRFVAREATGEGAGHLLTAPLLVHAGKETQLTLNADAKGGKIRVQTRNSAGEILPGFAFDDCIPITTDGFVTPVQWKSNSQLAQFDAQTVQLEFEITNAKLFAFDLREPSGDRTVVKQASATIAPESSHAETVALWLFDEPLSAANRSLLLDQTTNGNALTLNPGARIARGQFGNALETMAGGSRAAFRRYIDNSPLNLGDFDWTFELRINMKAAARPGSVIFELHQGPFEKGPRTALEIGQNSDELVFVCQGAGIEGQSLKTDPKLFAAQSDGWHHVVFEYEASAHRLTHWVDGRQIDSVILPSALRALTPTGENNLTLGSDISGFHALPAILDEVRVSKGIVYSESTFTPPDSFAPRKEPLKLGAGPQLFIDDGLIERSQNLTRATHQPQRLPEPVIREREIRPGWTQQCGGLTALYDNDLQKFRIWMSVKNVGFEGPDFYGSTYWESSDGVNWMAPNLGIIDFDGSRQNNLTMTGRTHNVRFHSDSVLDEGPNAADPSRRYKIGYFPYDWKDDRTRGMNVAFSPDGIHWKSYDQNPVLRHYDVEQGRPGAGVSVADINDMFYDAQRKLYVQTYKTYALPMEYPLAAEQRTPRWREVNDKVSGYRRIIGLCTSPDFIHWSNFQRVIMPDDADPPELQFYAMSILKRGDLYIAHVRCLDDQAEADGTGWMELATSRDLYHWTRYRDVFFDRNRSAGSWDGAICWHGRPVIVGDQMYFYYTGLGAGHKTGTRNTGLAKLRRDGYVSRDAGATRGTLLTAPLLIDPQNLTINATVQGEVRVRIVDEAGEPIPGFDWADCSQITGDSVALPVHWKQDASSLRAKPLRLEFALTNASLYGFELGDARAN